MNILVTGAAGFVGMNLVASLKNIRDNKDRTRPDLVIDEIYEYDVDTDNSALEGFCRNADFVFNLAGVNRAKDNAEFMEGNFGFASVLLNTLEKSNNKCPVMLSSSIQATLTDRYEGSEYGKSKLAGEELFFEYGKRTGTKVLVYRFPNLFGKWCRPNYNSAIATFCNNIANDLPIQVNNADTELELLYIDDLVNEMLDAIGNNEHHCKYVGVKVKPDSEGRYCFVKTTYSESLGNIVELLKTFKNQPNTLLLPEIEKDSFNTKLYSTYLSYMPEDDIKYGFKMNTDERGSFTELLKTKSNGQISVNISEPGITKGNHWHHSKWELFIVVSGHALIKERRIGLDNNGEEYPVISFEVTGDKLEAVHMLPGYTHDITNLSNTDKLITVMWANETFDNEHPDTFFEPVE